MSCVLAELFSFEKLHGDIRQIKLFAGVEHRNDVWVIEATGRFCLAEKTVACRGQIVFVKFFAQCDGLDGNHPVNFGISAEVNCTHGAPTNFLLNFVTSEHRFLQTAVVIDQKPRGPTGIALAQQGCFIERLIAFDSLRKIPKLRIVLGHVGVNRTRFVELTFALKVEGQRIQRLHHRIVKRTFAEFLKGNVQLALALESQAKHAVTLGAGFVGVCAKSFNHAKAFQSHHQVSAQQEHERCNQLEPELSAGKGAERRYDQQQCDKPGAEQGDPGSKPGHGKNNVQREKYHQGGFDRGCPSGTRDVISL